MAFPPGITVVRATPKNGGGNGELWRAPSPRPGGAPAPKKWGALSPPSPLPYGAPLRRARRGTREAQPRSAFPQSAREIRVVPCLMRVSGHSLDHNGEGFAL